MLKHYHYPSQIKKSKKFTFLVNNEVQEILETNVAYFITIAYDEEIEIKIQMDFNFKSIDIAPHKEAVTVKCDKNEAVFSLSKNMFLQIKIPELEKPILFYGNRLPESVQPSDVTHYFAAGSCYEVGDIVLHDNESLYIESGAIVCGAIYARKAKNVKIFGQGILDGSFFKGTPNKKMILLDECEHCTIEDIILIEPTSWMIMLAGCNEIRINGIKEIGEVMSSDGIDIVGSSHIAIADCFLKNNDDCVVVKAFPADAAFPESKWDKNVQNILVERCIFINDGGGNGIEIGHELMVPKISDIIFRDLDILQVGGIGAPFSIHAGDRATVSDVIFENIRVEHYYCKIIDFRVMKSQFNRDTERGQIKNIICRDIRLEEKNYNPGYTISVVGGYDENHLVDGVIFENFFINDRKIMNADELDIFTKHAKNIVFC